MTSEHVARERSVPAGVVLADTITRLPPEAHAAVLVCGSHGGLYPGCLAAGAALRAVVLCDAGVGKDGAGIASLDYLAGLGIAAATVSSATCRIGDSADMMRQGVISHANALATTLGVVPGLGCREAAYRLVEAPLRRVDPPPVGESRQEIAGPGLRRIVLLDSAADVRPDDAGQIVVTGSHGGLIGGEPSKALRVDAFAAVFNDAGIGLGGAGLARLAALESRGIAAFTVGAATARIGEARSTFEDGIISAANRTATRIGATTGSAARQILESWARIASPHLRNSP